MFPTLKLFHGIPCPENNPPHSKCSRSPCMFSHLLTYNKPSSSHYSSSSQEVLNRTRPLNANNKLKQVEPRKIVDLPIRRSSNQILTPPITNNQSASTSSSPSPSSFNSVTKAINPEVPVKKPQPLIKHQRYRSKTEPSSSTVKVSHYVPSPESLRPPKVHITRSTVSHTATSTRQKLLESLYESYTKYYLNTLKFPEKVSKSLAFRDSINEEEDCHSQSTSKTYRNLIINRIVSLKKRKFDEEEIELVDRSETKSSKLFLDQDHLIKFFSGTLQQFEKNQEEFQKFKKKKQRSLNGEGQEDEEEKAWYSKLEKFLLTKEKMLKLDYVVEIPEDDQNQRKSKREDMFSLGQSLSSLITGNLTCERCSKNFKISESGDEQVEDECEYHWGKPIFEKIDGVKQRMFSCCNESSAKGCTTGRHVFIEKLPAQLHSRVPFSRLPSSSPLTETKLVRLVAMDCEMIYTSIGLTLARSTIIVPSFDPDDRSGFKTLLDKFIRLPPNVKVLDLNTRFSGIGSEEILRRSGTSLEELRDKVLPELGILKDTIICGHGLENDLKAMRIVHDRCIDTVDLFPHPHGLPKRMSLKNLASSIFKRFIQTNNDRIITNEEESEGDNDDVEADSADVKDLGKDDLSKTLSEKNKKKEKKKKKSLNKREKIVVVQGHDSLEDAAVALDLLKHKVENDKSS